MSLTAASPLTFAVNTTSTGSLTSTASATIPKTLTTPPDNVTVNSGVTVESTAGNVTLQAADSVILDTGSVVKSDTGNVILTASYLSGTDTTGGLTLGGTISASTGITLSADQDIVMGQMTLTTGTLSVTSNLGNIRDDGIDTTYIQAPNISLTAAKAIGGDTQISRNDVLLQDTVFQQAIDFILQGGTLTLSQTGAGSNIQLRDVSGDFDTSELGGVIPQGTGNQLALIAAGGTVTSTPTGDLVVNSALTLAATNNVNLLLAATEPNDVDVNNPVTNIGSSGTVTVVAVQLVNIVAAINSGGSVNLTSAGADAFAGIGINANVTASGTGATITVDCNATVVLTGTATLSTTSASGGAVTVIVGENLANFPINTFIIGGLEMAANSAISTAANNSAINITVNVQPVMLLTFPSSVATPSANITVAVIDAGTGPVNLLSTTGSIADANGSGTLNVTGGAIGLTAIGIGINLDVNTTTPTTAGVTANSNNSPITLRSAGHLQVTSINAGTSTVNLSVGTATATGTLTSLHPNTGVPDVIGSTVTLTAIGPTDGATGQIGFFTTGAQFFQVQATTIDASTDNSRLWIWAIGGTAVGTINAGTDFAILKTTAGNLTSTHTGSTPDITAGTVVLIANNGSLGDSGTQPLLVQTATLNASITGTGSINVTNVDAGGNLNVTQALTASGPINLMVQGGNLTVSGTTSPVIDAPGNTVTLSGGAAVLSGTAAGIIDIAASGLAVTYATDIGTAANPLETSVTTFAAFVTTGGVVVANVGALTIGTVGAASGIMVEPPFPGGVVNPLVVPMGTSQAIDITAIGPLTVANNVTGPANITLSALASVPPVGNTNLTVNSSVTVESKAGNVTLSAVQAVNLLPGSVVNAEAGQVTLQLSSGDILGTVEQGGTGSPIVTGAAGTGALTINFAGGANLPQGLSYNAVAGTSSTLDIDDVGSTFAHTYTASSTAVSRDATTIGITGVQQVDIGGSNAMDNFYVTPSPTTAFSITGGTAPSFPTTPGNSLTVTALGKSVTVTADTIAAGTLALVSYADINTLTITDKSGPYIFPGLSANQRFVQALYLDTLKRLGSTAELNGWVSVLPGIGQSGVTHGIMQSREALTRVVDSMYELYLGRPADPIGETNFTNDLLGGDTEEQVAAGMLSSAEFQTRANALVGGSNASSNYVAALYMLLLNRTGSAAEIATHVALLPSDGFAGVAATFLGSTEFRSNAVRTFYGDPTLTPLPAQFVFARSLVPPGGADSRGNQRVGDFGAGYT